MIIEVENFVMIFANVSLTDKYLTQTLEKKLGF